MRNKHSMLPEAGTALTTPVTYDVEPAASFITFGDALGALWRRKLIVAGMAALGGAVALAMAFSQTPIYQAKALVEVQGINENFLNRRDLDPSVDGGVMQFDAYVQTQIKIIQTERLLGKVAERLHLDREPEFHPKPRLLARLTGRSAPPAGTRGVREGLMAAMLARLAVRLSGETRLIEIKFESQSPELAASMANALAEEYIAQNLDKRLSATQHTGKWLTAQLEELKGTLDQAERELQRYLTSNDLLFSNDTQKDSVAEARLRQLQAALTAAQEARIVEQSRYELVAKVPVNEVSGAIDSDTIRSYQTKLTDLRQKFAEARTVFKPEHYRVQQIQAEMVAVETALERERREMMNRLRTQYESARQRESMIRTDLEAQLALVRTQSARGVEYGTLKSSVDTYRKLYDSTLKQVKETEMASAIRANNVQIAENAAPPMAPVRPSKMLYLSGGIFAGLLLGAVSAMHLDRNYRLVRAPGEVSSRLGIVELGPIPSAAVDLPYSVKPVSRWLPALALRKEPEGCEKEELLRNWLETVSWRHRESTMAESYRGALASLLHSGAGDVPRVVVVTSACAGEGKTTTVTNLGITLAESGRRVLLIDADRRCPHLHGIFDRPNDHGFGDYLLEHTALSDATLATLISRTEIPRLDILPSGSDRSCVPNLVDNQRAAQLLDALRLRYDSVLIDTPPMLALSDARGLGRMADGVALVIGAGRTPEHILAAASERLRQDGTRILGSILNNWQPSRSFTGRYHEAGYRYGDRYQKS